MQTGSRESFSCQRGGLAAERGCGGLLSRRLFAGGSFIKHGEVVHAAVAVLIGPDQLVIVILRVDVVVANFDR
jgi:hypothetical protein